MDAPGIHRPGRSLLAARQRGRKSSGGRMARRGRSNSDSYRDAAPLHRRPHRPLTTMRLFVRAAQGRVRAAVLWSLLPVLLAATGCAQIVTPAGPSPTPIPPGTRVPLPTLAPVAPTPPVGPSPPPPTLPPPTPDVQPTRPPSPTRPTGGPAPLPTLVPLTPDPAPTLPGQAIELPRDIGFDGGWWAVLFSPGATGNQNN